MTGSTTPGQLLLIGVIFTVVGALIIVLPTSSLLKVDRSTGYRLYRSAPDEHSGQRQAAAFYVLFGLVFVVVGLGAVFVALLAILS